MSGFPVCRVAVYTIQYNTALRQTRATWMSRKGKGEVATQCSKCRSVNMPTDEQLIRMYEKKLKDVQEESELRLCSSSSS